MTNRIGRFWRKGSIAIAKLRAKRILNAGTYPLVAFHLASLGEIQFFLPVLRLYLERYSSRQVVLFHEQDTIASFQQAQPELRGRILHFPAAKKDKYSFFQRLALYITTEQFGSGPRGVFTLTLFHGQPSKGLTFQFGKHLALEANDALFLYGPLQRDTLERYLKRTGRTLPAHLRLYDIGYAKTDPLLRGEFDRTAILSELGLDSARPTLLYAPAFNEGASMREWGVEILETLSSNPGFNVIAKLAIDCLEPAQNQYANGGVDWFQEIGRLEKRFPNFRLFRKLDANEAMAASDVLITCVSSIGFDFLALGRPVVYIETPKFYEVLRRDHFPDWDVAACARDVTINGGKEFGIVVQKPSELPDAVRRALQPRDSAQVAAIRDYILYNPGSAAEAALNQIVRLLEEKPPSLRPQRSS